MGGSLSGGSIRILWDAATSAVVTITGGSAAFTVGGSPITFPYTLTSSTSFDTVNPGDYTVSVTHQGYEVANTPDGTKAVSLKFGEQVVFAPSVDGGQGGNPQSLLSGLSATYAARSFTKSDAAAGTIDWVQDGTSGYLLHLTSGVNSASGTYAIGIGTDQGLGGGILLSVKSANGTGLRIITDPAAGFGSWISGYGSNPTIYGQMYVGAGGLRMDAAAGAGFSDGVTNGTTTFTSATATFVPGDVGATLEILHGSLGQFYTPFAGSAQVVISGYVDAQTVTLATAASASYTGLRFKVTGRIPATSQALISGRDTDSTTVLYSLGRGEHFLSGAVGQTNSIFKVFKGGNGTAALEVDSTGKAFSRFAADLTNAGQTGQIAANVRTYGTGTVALQVQGVAAQTADQVRIVDSGGTIQSRFNKAGAFMTRVTTIPADADLSAGEMSIWFDSTNGASKLMVKAKQADGTVKTASVALA